MRYKVSELKTLKNSAGKIIWLGTVRQTVVTANDEKAAIRKSKYKAKGYTDLNGIMVEYKPVVEDITQSFYYQKKKSLRYEAGD